MNTKIILNNRRSLLADLVKTIKRGVGSFRTSDYGGRYQSNLFNQQMYGGVRRSSPTTSFVSGKIIYFYEWSNIYSMPSRFNTMYDFEGFCRHSNIPLENWQKDVIDELNTCYVTCKRGSKELIIRKEWTRLRDALNAYG